MRSPVKEPLGSGGRDRSCAAVLNETRSSILMVKHCHAGKTYWTFPGGACEPGETFEHAAVREVREETGIHVRILEHVFDEVYLHQGIESTSRCFLASQVGSTPIVLGSDPEELTKEPSTRMLQAVRWVPLEEVYGDRQVSRVLAHLVTRGPAERQRQVVAQFWQAISDADFAKLELVMTPEAKVYLPNTREVIQGCGNYIRFNKTYPGRWYATVERTSESGHSVMTTTKVWSRDTPLSFYVTSYFTFEADRIQEIWEYWGENSEPPEWRRDGALTSRYEASR